MDKKFGRDKKIWEGLKHLCQCLPAYFCTMLFQGHGLASINSAHKITTSILNQDAHNQRLCSRDLSLLSYEHLALRFWSSRCTFAILSDHFIPKWQVQQWSLKDGDNFSNNWCKPGSRSSETPFAVSGEAMEHIWEPLLVVHGIKKCIKSNGTMLPHRTITYQSLPTTMTIISIVLVLIVAILRTAAILKARLRVPWRHTANPHYWQVGREKVRHPWPE